MPRLGTIREYVSARVEVSVHSNTPQQLHLSMLMVAQKIATYPEAQASRVIASRPPPGHCDFRTPSRQIGSMAAPSGRTSAL